MLLCPWAGANILLEFFRGWQFFFLLLYLLTYYCDCEVRFLLLFGWLFWVSIVTGGTFVGCYTFSFCISHWWLIIWEVFITFTTFAEILKPLSFCCSRCKICLESRILSHSSPWAKICFQTRSLCLEWRILWYTFTLIICIIFHVIAEQIIRSWILIFVITFTFSYVRTCIFSRIRNRLFALD